MEVLLTTLTFVAAEPPNVTCAPDTNAVPVIVTAVPPAVDPALGKIELTVGADPLAVTYVYPPVGVALLPSAFWTTTSVAPAACGGVVAVIEVLLETVMFVAAAPPTVTCAPEKKPVPVIVTAVPPAVGPEFGEMPVMVGGGPFPMPER